MGAGESFVRFTCPNPGCRKQLRVSARFAGKKIQCPGEECGWAIRIPEPAECGIPDAIIVTDPPAPNPKRAPAPRAEAPLDRPRRRPPPEVEYQEEREEPRRHNPVAEPEPDVDFEDEPEREPRRRKKRRKKRRSSEASPQLRYARKRAAGILFGVAVAQFLCGGLVVGLGSAVNAVVPLPDGVLLFVILEWVTLTLTFAGLGVWACYRPFFPALIGLVIYAGYSIFTIIDAFTTMPVLAVRMTIFRIIMVTSLVRAVLDAWSAD